MGHFFDIEAHSERFGPIKHRGRVYRVVNRRGDFMWYEVTQETTIGGEKLCDASFAVWDLDQFPISQDDLDRALTRKIKTSSLESTGPTRG